MTIIIYKLNDGKAIEIDRWSNGKFKGKLKKRSMTEEEVLNQFNRGYYRTSEV